MENSSLQRHYRESIWAKHSQPYAWNQNRLDSFHTRGLTYVLGIEHSYYSHNTNEEVIERMNLALNDATDLGQKPGNKSKSARSGLGETTKTQQFGETLYLIDN